MYKVGDMKLLRYILLMATFAVACMSCHEQEEFDNDPYGNFDALWTNVDQHYCFFKYKNIDWEAVGRKYRAQLRPDMSSSALFAVCAEMLKELRDGHTNLVSAWDVSRYWIWEQYSKNYDERVINEYYLNFEYKQASGIKYAILSNNFGYMYYGDFTSGIGEGNLDSILAYLASSDGLVIDVRDNGGGYLTNVEKLVGRFITEKLHAGAISHKTGPGHNDFSEPFNYYIDPAPDTRIKYLKPIVILTNRSSFSATNNFVSIMKNLPNVRVVGDTTGGGSGLPFTYDMPNGWLVRMSASEITDSKGVVTEFGVEPSPGCKVDMTEEEIAVGKDAILEKGFDVLKTIINKTKY